MTEDPKGTTVWLDGSMIAEADAIAAQYRLTEGDKVTRTAIVRRALHSLFLRVCLTDNQNVIPIVDQVQE